MLSDIDSLARSERRSDLKRDDQGSQASSMQTEGMGLVLVWPNTRLAATRWMRSRVVICAEVGKARARPHAAPDST